MPSPDDFNVPIEPVARAVLEEFMGAPNKALSSRTELRWGSHGSVSVDLTKNVWSDHEEQTGGGVLDLLKAFKGYEKPEALQWLQEQGLIEKRERPANGAANGQHAPQGKFAGFMDHHPIATYAYHDAKGALAYEVLKFAKDAPRRFMQRRPHPSGKGWIWGLQEGLYGRVKSGDWFKAKSGKTYEAEEQFPDAVRWLYRRVDVLAAIENGDPVFLCEGEKDAETLHGWGFCGTTNAGGAKYWSDQFDEDLTGADIVILPDNDDAGRKHAEQVRKTLRDIATEVHVIELPGLPEKGDISDWLAAGGTADELLRLVAEARQKPAPAMPEIIGDDDVEGRKPAQTDLLVRYAKERFDLLHDKNGEAFARDQRTGEVRRMGSRSFRDRVTAGFFEDREVAVRDQSWREALGTLQALARFEGDPQEISIRVAGRDGRYWVDLCQPGNSRAVEIDANGWRVVERPPVLFVRSDSMQPLPEPLHGGDIAPLWSIANIPEEQRLLVLAWLLECMRPDTPYPGVELIGEQGSGKSTASEALRRVIDPNGCNLRGAPKTVEDIYVSAGQNLVVAYENVSHLHGGMQDALAVLSTGGGFAKRQLFTDADEHVISVRRPWLVNGISASVTQQDLVDRVISVECPVIAERESSSKQWQAFERDLPGILGGLYDLAVGALRELPGITLAREDRPRLVEFVLLGMAMATHMGIDPAEFLRQFKVTRAETVARTLDASPVATALLDMLEAEPCGITASVKVILTNLERYKPMGADAWPRSPKGLGDALRRAAPALRQVGVECKCIGKSHGVITWSIRKARQESKSPMSTKSPDESNSGDMGTLGTSHPAETLVTEAL